MSLINDALKRARDTQPSDAAPAAGPSFQPVPLRASNGSDFLLPLLVGVILTLAGLFLWQWFHGGAGALKVRARTVTETSVAVAPATASTAPQKSPEKISVPVAVPVTPKLTPVVAAVPVAKPAPITYKLQGIFYSASNPSAMINGKMVYAGSRLGDAKVLAVDKNSATLVSADGATNVLELPQ